MPKSIILGKNNPYIQDLLSILYKDDNKVAKIAYSGSSLPSSINKWIYEKYSPQDIDSIVDNSAYIFWGTSYNGASIGCTIEEFEKSDIIYMPYECARFFNKNAIRNTDAYFIWVDDTLGHRISAAAGSGIDIKQFNSTEEYEELFKTEFDGLISSRIADIMYFNNMTPEQMYAIIKAIIVHPDLYNIFIKNFR